jgi:SagB-type dehydrogenase family enzyme
MKKKVFLPTLPSMLKLPSDPLEKFHDLTKFKKWSKFLPVEKWPKSWKIVVFKEYPRLDKVLLPPPTLLDTISLKKILYSRYSSRYFGKQKITLDQISNLLYYSSGIQDFKNPWKAKRFYPSPGGRYSIEIYLVSLKSDLPKGVYHYNVRTHTLEMIKELKTFKKDYYVNQDWIYNASMLIFFTAIFERNTIKYGYRGYRHVLQEAGHIGQNFYLLAPAFNIRICGIGGYVDDRINTLLDVDGLGETVIYGLAIGSNGV